MFYKMIENKCNQWYASSECTAKPLIDYIVSMGQMRDAQIEAIKTYLFLKIACNCRPLHELLSNGDFNSLDIGELPLPDSVKTFLRQNPAAAALYEYATQTNDQGEQVSPKLKAQIENAPESIDYTQFLKDAFYGIDYTDYLFSLPMGAGKTYLMAAFIYLDLYFATNEPHNPAFAHNFIIFAPSGLKSSVVPSLRTIQNFDPTWVLPDPAASEIRRKIIFEVLDQRKTEKKSNKTKNPNVQKIANHQPLNELFGLVAVTNAEKVILDRIVEKSGQVSLFEDSEDDADRQANELRNLIGKLPALSVFIDEVHHAVSEEIKLRAVVNRWAANQTVNAVVGFSGTPYLEKAEKIKADDGLTVATAEITNIVYYYPLINGVGNFLKRPIVKVTEGATSVQIIEQGIRAFLDQYKDAVYPDGTTAKLGVYCGSIRKLEEMVYPLASRIVAEYGMASDCILRFYRKSSSKDPNEKKYTAPADSQMQFEMLDKPFSRTRIVLLVQIGKEGWDCRSLTGIILSQEGDCPKNMVLQTSCRCLRQVVKGAPETALIYLNDSNGEKLNEQLQKQHHVTLREFMDANGAKATLKRYDRTKYLKLPKVDFYQLAIRYTTELTEALAPEKYIPVAADSAKADQAIVRTKNLEMQDLSVTVDDTERGTKFAAFHPWLYAITKGSFGTLTLSDLKPYEDLLHTVFDTITYENDGSRYFSSRYDHAIVEANIRKAFAEKRTCNTSEEVIPTEASLLYAANFTETVNTQTPEQYFPEQKVVENIIKADAGKWKPKPEIEAAIAALEAVGDSANRDIIDNLRKQNTAHPQKDRTFHYLPYHTDSSFEQTFLNEVLSFPQLEQLGLEVYYNGDRALTEFKIKCYQKTGSGWRYIGLYTPDFLIIQRNTENKIHKAIIVETKGQIYANDPTFKEKRHFMETEFLRQNNAAFGYVRFEYLYMEDTLQERDRLVLVQQKMNEFFGG